MSEEVLGQRIDMIVSSPMRRALQTALLTMDFITDRGIRIIPDARWQETSNRPCDIGTDVLRLAPQFPSIDFFDLDTTWPKKRAKYAYRKEAVLERAQSALFDLYARDEKVIAIVSHGHFLRTAVANKEFYNADMRIFVMKKNKDRIHLVERRRTVENGGYLHRDNSAYRAIEDRDFQPEVKSKSPVLKQKKASNGSTSFTSSPQITQEGRPMRVLPPLYFVKTAANKQGSLDNQPMREFIIRAPESSQLNEATEPLKERYLPIQNGDTRKNMKRFGKESDSSAVSMRWPYGDFTWPESELKRL